jgi:protein-tyrosine phosphatase
MLDFHNHLMPGVDDGAANVDESRAGLAALAAEGVGEIITTPHFSASLLKRGEHLRYLERVERGWEALQELVKAEFPYIRIERGFEIMLDIPQPVLGDPIYHLAGTSFVLVEFPYMNIPPNSSYALRELRQAGLTPIVAHPERYSNMEEKRGLVEEWHDAGAYMQVNCGSLVGVYGSRAKNLAWSILGSGEAEYIGSDYHSRGRCSVEAARAALKHRGLDDQIATLDLNGNRLLAGEAPYPVQSFEAAAKAGWKKVFPWV